VPTQKPTAKERAVSWPKDFDLTDKRRQVALDAGIRPGRIDSVFEGMRDWAASKGSTYVDWDAAWRKWVKNPIQDKDRVNPTGSNGAVDWNDPVAREAHRKQAERDMLKRL